MTEKIIYALGFFDGVHRGHQALLSACRELAEKTGALPGAVTFDTHPETLLRGVTPGLLNSITDRQTLLRSYGMARVLVLPFDRETMQIPYRDFFRMMIERYGAAGFVCGEDYRFGYKGEGTPQLLQALCREADIPCRVLPKLREDGEDISSTRIRALLERGELQQANRLLGHPHILSGEVLPGRQLGRTIGIPTANLHLPENVDCLRFGVYACKVTVDGKEYMAVTNVGTRPTVGGERVTVEPYLINFDGDLYGKTIRVAFHQFLRPERKFASLEELQEEIQKNILQTVKFFEKSE